MDANNFYDVTKWNIGNPYKDIGEVINSIIADIKLKQDKTDVNNGGKPGATIYIPSGDYHLRTQVLIDISYLKIIGNGHGFISSSIRYNIAKEEWLDLHEIWPGGSRIIVDISAKNGKEQEGAAFYIKRNGNPRISSVEFENFCVDGLHFGTDELNIEDPENSYINNKTAIYIESANDSFKINNMGFVYLEHALTIYNADAISIHDNFIAECGNCIELRGWGQASKITDNLIGAGYNGYSIYAENFGGLLISSNNIFPRGKSSIHFYNVSRSIVTSNRLHSFYPGMIVLENKCLENLISSNHILRDNEPWTPMLIYNNKLNDLYGLININGNNNSIISNHISLSIANASINPKDEKPVVIHIDSGMGNFISSNHIVATTTASDEYSSSDSCYESQVDSLTSTDKMRILDIIAVKIEKDSYQNIVLDSCSAEQIIADVAINSVRTISIPAVNM